MTGEGASRRSLRYLGLRLDRSMLDIRLPADIEARLDDIVRRTGRTKAFFVQEAVVERLADLEDVYLAEARLEELRPGRSRSYSLADVERDVEMHGI